MASFIKKFSVSSPDSTVSSLLASYSIDNSNPYSNSVIHYKDKLYSSASEALEAYIEDFDLSLMSSEISTGKICISQSTPKHTEFSKHRTKERYVFEDFDEHAGLGSIASPCRRRTECDLDLISLTTDDLLTFPADGSRPFVQRSHFKSRHQSSEWNRWSLKKSTFYPYQTSSLHIEKDFCLQENDKSVANQKLHKNFSKKKHSVEDQLELMLEAEKSLETSTEDLSNVLKNDDSPSTIDILEAERSWENIPVAFKSPVPVCCEDEENTLPFPKADIVHDFLEDCINEKNKENTFSGGNHHGPTETLKLMLFNLQAVHESLNQNKIAEEKEEFEKLSEKADAELELCDSEMIPVTNSLQKALHHLSRLKSLVEDTSSKQEQTDDHQEDKQEEKMSDL
ncbi:lung adenoma susceptibility protein 2-like isoform X4 [Dromaius novaehollandiae]|uniref:lung adenoma susceptibility protein 2 isoform X4 n=1 Tax=Dromaius novaehollandiae TaxID=8790 RepID=UPI000E1E5E3D|nr:lung adenoma susceptibility protein 2 isoform X3 [Dromaius novaehollandiae]